MGSLVGAQKSAAVKAGCTLDTWRERRAAGLRWCWECKTWKEQGLFAVDNSRGGQLSSRCKGCTNTASTASRYGISKEAVRNIRKAACSICGEKSPNMYVDHQHASGVVRGPLCPSCNSGIGQFRERPDLLQKAIEYLAATEVMSIGS
jgi:hypothetical protein